MFPELLVILKTTVRFHRRLADYRSLVPFLAKLLTSLPLTAPTQMPEHALNALYVLATLSYETTLLNEFATAPGFQDYLLRELYLHRPPRGTPAPEFLDFYVPLSVIFANLAQSSPFLREVCIGQCRLVPLEQPGPLARNEDIIKLPGRDNPILYLRV